jgi:hypothetical protein
MRTLLIASLIALSIPGSAQPRIVEPDPNSGRPLLLAGLDSALEVPISVYSGTDVDLFITPSALNASLYFKSGFYVVYLYSFYKHGYQCKSTGLFADTLTLKLPQFLQLCSLVGYKLRQYEVDTVGKRFRITMSELIDTDGNADITTVHGAGPWMKFDELESGTHWTAEPGTKAAFDRITAMVQKKRQDFVLRNKP